MSSVLPVRLLTFAAFLFAASSLAALQTNVTPNYAWVQMTGSGAEVRVLLPAGTPCPAVRAGHRELQLSRRPDPAKSIGGFPETCQAVLPTGVHTVAVNGRKLRAASKAIRTIVVVGDTGCRVTRGEAQDCAHDWPFAKIVDFAAAQHPDLIIHVGDYYYREKCQSAAAHCENWDNWQLDFFSPAAKLFASAPWIFARGNHESCSRASEGWYRYLDAGDTPLACPGAHSPAFLVPIGGVTLGVVDTNNTPDNWPADKKLASYQEDLAPVRNGEGSPLWLVTHKPPFVRGLMNFPDQAEIPETDPVIAGLDMILAGHLHLFGSLDFAGSRPSQLIVGDSGTRLMVQASKEDASISKDDPTKLVQGTKFVDGKPANYTIKGRFGYFLLHRPKANGAAWKGTLFGTANEVLARCVLAGRELHCAPGDAPAPALR